MPAERADRDYLDDELVDQAFDQAEDLDQIEQLPEGEDALAPINSEEPDMQPRTDEDDRTRIKGGERGDDDRAVEALDNEKADHQDELLDEGVEETFPASDPVSVKRIT